MNSKQKFIFYAPHLPAFASNAAAVRCEVLIEEMRRAGFQVEVWSHGSMPGDQDRRIFFSLPSNRFGFFKRFIFEFFVGLELCLRFLILKVFGGLKKRPVILSSPPYVVCLIAAWALRFLRAEYYLDIRDLYPEAYFHKGLFSEDSFVGRWQKNRARAFYKGATHIFAATEGLQKVIGDYLGDSRNITLVRNGFDERLFYLGGDKHKNFTCVFHGSLGHMQNLDLLVDVASAVYEKNKDIQFLVMGRGAQEAKLSEGHLPLNMKYLGEVGYKSIPSEISRCHLGLSFRLGGLMGETAFPVKVFEYLGVGVPVVVTPLGEAGRVLSDLNVGFQYDNSQVAEIVYKILELSENQEMHLALCEEVQKVRSRFSRQSSAGHAVEVLNGD